jgi:hypothetical protein
MVDPSIAAALRLLGLQAGATQAELKRAWHKVALETHPDLNGGALATQGFGRARGAYELLVDRGTGSAASASSSAGGGRAWREPRQLGGTVAHVRAPVSPYYHSEQAQLERMYGERSRWNREGLHRVVVGAHVKRWRKG